MSLNIKNEESVRLAKQLAERTGESLTGAITTALRERLDRLESDEEHRRERVVAQLTAIARDSAPRWKELLRSTDHGDYLYDERGLPR